MINGVAATILAKGQTLQRETAYCMSHAYGRTLMFHILSGVPGYTL